MAGTSASNTATWTNYPSLLSSLPTQEQRDALEDAARAQVAGRYIDARLIYETRLPASSTVPILTLQRADLLTAQSLEHERIPLVTEGLSLVAESGKPNALLQMLLELMLADARYWAIGELEPALTVCQKLRDLIDKIGMQDPSDLLLRCINIYYQLVDSLYEVCNSLSEIDMCVSRKFQGNRLAEITQIRQILQDRKDWRYAAVFMLQELAHTSDPHRGQAMSTALAMCDALARLKIPALLFRSAALQRQVAAMIAGFSPSSAAALRERALTTIKSLSSEQWEVCWPLIAWDAAKAEILGAETSPEEKTMAMLDLVGKAEARQDYTKANQAYISSRDIAKIWVDNAKSTESEPLALKSLREAQNAHRCFHRERSRLAFFEGYAVADHMATLTFRDLEYSIAVEQAEGFWRRHPSFEVPQTQARLYDQASIAAAFLGMVDRRESFDVEYQHWLQRCSSQTRIDGQSVGLLDVGVVYHQVMKKGDTLAEWGSNALRMMLKWAGIEHDQGMLSSQECKAVFSPGLDNVPQEALRTYLDDHTSDLATAIFGTMEAPTSTEYFQDQFHTLSDWILKPNRPPSRSARILVLRLFMQSRLYRLRHALIKARQQPEQEQAVALEQEEQVLIEFQSFEEADRSQSQQRADNVVWARVQATLVRSFVPAAAAKGLINDAELRERIEDCQGLLTQQRNSQSLIARYNTLVQLLRLFWQRFLLSKTIDPDDSQLQLYTDQAERIFAQIRQQLSDLNPPQALAASTRLSEVFSHREHYNYALAAEFTAAQNVFPQSYKQTPEEAAARVRQARDRMAEWSIRSKGRAFFDILATRSLVLATEAALNSLHRVDEDSSNASPSLEKEREHIELLTLSLPDDLVVVDFVDIRYAEATRFAALMYRKGRPSVLKPLPRVDNGQLDRWVAEHLNRGGPHTTHLSDAGARAALEELGGMLDPLFEAAPERLIREGDIVVLCPTGSLHRIPIHAVPVEGKPLIERNPVLYCQSIPLLTEIWKRYTGQAMAHEAPKAIVLNPIQEIWKPPKDQPLKPSLTVVSKATTFLLARTLRATHRHGFDLKRSNIQEDLSGANILHYHGHVKYSPRKTASALDTALILNRTAYSSSDPKRTGYEALTARDLFAVKLGDLALATIIGCGSGVSTISSTDDVLGLPTALLYAGAGAVVSTLWPTADSDGAAFAAEFYTALLEQRSAVSAATGVGVLDTEASAESVARVHGQGEGRLAKGIDVARAMQTAVLRLRSNDTRENQQAPYHWAGFTLTGIWLSPMHNFSQL